MRQPFFSIVIPTKNRPHLLRDAILSVLLQDFQDYELIISDNFNDERTKKVVDEFSTDSRLKYFRTDRELNIPDHWEFATLKAKGKYMLVLSDRSLLRPGALQEIHRIIQNSSQDISVYTWQHLIFDNETGLLRAVWRANNRTEVFLGRKLLEEYGNTQGRDYRFPLILNSCYREELATEIRRKHGRLFGPICPDGFASFLMLSYTEKVASLNKPLFILQGAKNSTGMLTDLYSPDLYLSTLRFNNWFRYVPIKVSFRHNLAFSDYLTVRAIVSGKLNLADVNWVTYFLRCYEELVYLGKFGFIRERREEFLREWERALQSFDKDIQTLVRKKTKWARILFTIKAFLAKSPFLPLLRKIQNRVEFGYPNKTYTNALEASGFRREDISNKFPKLAI